MRLRFIVANSGDRGRSSDSFNFHLQRQLLNISVVYYDPSNAGCFHRVDVATAELHCRFNLLRSELGVCTGDGTDALLSMIVLTWLSFRFCFSPSQTHSEQAPDDEWLDILPHPVFSPDGDSFMLLAGIQETNTEHFTHIKHVTITQQRISVISHGRYEVSENSSVPFRVWN